ncbi:MAK10-like protein [Tanacetum coccineum]
MDPKCSTQIYGSINTITIHPKQPKESQVNGPEVEEQEEKDDQEKINTNPSPQPYPSDDDDIIFIEIIKKDDDSHIEELEVGENTGVGELEVEYFDIFMTRKGCPSNLKVSCNIGYVHVEKAYIDLNSPLNVMTRMLYNWIMRRKLDPKENTNGGVNNFTRRIKGVHVFVGNFTYVIDFMAIEDISSIIDPRNEEDNRRGVEYVMSKILGFYKECLELGPEYVTGTADEGEVTKEHVIFDKKKIGNVSVKDFEPTLPLIKKKFTVVDANFMVREVYDEEIKEVTFQIDGTKPPYIYNGFFFSFLQEGISRKYSGIIPSAFVPNRHIQDNILLSQKLLKGCDRKDGPNRVAMKIDTQKAYDTVYWKFLECIVKGFGFHEKMVMEVMSLIVQDKVEMNKEFGYHFGCKQMKLTHVCFADDLLIFCQVIKDLNTLKEAIEEFGSLSGLRSNYDKSTIIFSSMQIENKQAILEYVPFKVEQLPVKYLGGPLTSKRIGVNNCRSLIDKIKN